MDKKAETPKLEMIDGGLENYARELLHLAAKGTDEFGKAVEHLKRKAKLSVVSAADIPPEPARH